MGYALEMSMTQQVVQGHMVRCDAIPTRMPLPHPMQIIILMIIIQTQASPDDKQRRLGDEHKGDFTGAPHTTH